MQIFIDESGNFGTDGRHFVIAALIPHDPKRIKNLVRHSCVDFGAETPLPELKGYTLPFPQKQIFFNNLTSKKDFEIAYIVADKHHLNRRLLAEQNVCFNYLAGHMLKPIVKKASEDIEIMCDNRNVKVQAGRSFSDYLKLQAYSSWGFGHRINMCYSDSCQSYHLQAADLIANAVYAKYERGKNHFYGAFQPHIRHGIRFPGKSFGQ